MERIDGSRKALVETDTKKLAGLCPRDLLEPHQHGGAMKKGVCMILSFVFIFMGTVNGLSEYITGDALKPVRNLRMLTETEWVAYCAYACEKLTTQCSPEEYLRLLEKHHIYYVTAVFDEDVLKLEFTPYLQLHVHGDPITKAEMVYMDGQNSLPLSLEIEYGAGALLAGLVTPEEMEFHYWGGQDIESFPFEENAFAAAYESLRNRFPENGNHSELQRAMAEVFIMANSACLGLSRQDFASALALLDTKLSAVRDGEKDTWFSTDSFSLEKDFSLNISHFFNDEKQLVAITLEMVPPRSDLLFEMATSHNRFIMPMMIIQADNTWLATLLGHPSSSFE